MKKTIFLMLLSLAILSCGKSVKNEQQTKANDDLDSIVLLQLKQAGSDLSKPHPINFYLYFPDHKNAAEAGDLLQEKGYVTEVRIGGDGTSWLCLATISIVPTIDTITTKTNELQTISTSLNGEYDGWEAPIVK